MLNAMRPALLLPLLLLAACQKGPVSQRPPTSAELAQVMGMIQTLEIKPPKGARNFSLSQGTTAARLEDLLKDGRLPLTVGLLRTGCEDGQHRLAVITVEGSSSFCFKLPSAYGVTVPNPTAGKPLPLNRWVPVYAVQPFVQQADNQIADENPAHWTLVSVYFSDKADLDPRKLPPASSAVELLR